MLVGERSLNVCTLNLFLGYLSRRRCIIVCYLFINGMNDNTYSYLLSLARCQKPPYKTCKVFARLKNPTQTFALSRRDQMQSSLFLAHIFTTHLVLERSRLQFLVPTFVVGIFPFQDLQGLGTRATFVADPSSLCKIKLCSHSPKKGKAQKQCDRPNPLLD